MIESKIYKFEIDFNDDLITNEFIDKIEELLENISVFHKKNYDTHYEIYLDISKYLEYKKKDKKTLKIQLNLRLIKLN